MVTPASLMIPDEILLEIHREKDACDVIVKMDDGTVFTSIFATLKYIQRQMELSYAVTDQLPDTPAVRYAVIDTPHMLVDELNSEIIEDVIDNLIALDMFESHFTRVTEHEVDIEVDPNGTRTTNDGGRTTQEVAAVVISDVLVTQNCD